MVDLSEVHALEAWREITIGVEGARDVLAAAETEFISLHLSGQPTRKLERKLADSLSEVDWRWPWFEEWLKAFNAWDLWPYMWPGLEPDDDDDYGTEELAQYRRQAIAPLIVHTASMAAYRNMRLASDVSSSRLFSFTTGGMGDGAEERVAAQFKARIEAGDTTHLPPFFPGDRTGLILRRIK